MMKKDSQLLVSCLLAGSLLGLPAFAQAEDQNSNAGDSIISVALADNGGEHGGKREHERLTDDQLEKMSTLKNQFEQATIMQKAQLRLLHAQMHELMMKSSVDRSGILAIQSKINALHDELSNRFLNYHLDRMEVLTPTQREEMRHRMLEHSAFGGGWGHGHGGHRHDCGHGHWQGGGEHGGGEHGHGNWQGGGHGHGEHGNWQGRMDEHKDGADRHDS